MGLFKKRDKEQKDVSDTMSWFLSDDAYNSLCVAGYTRLSDNAEFQTGINVIADLVSDMSIMLIANTENGDKRIHNELSRVIDIHPHPMLTRKKLMKFIVYNLLIDGNQITYPNVDRNGLLVSLNPKRSSQVRLEDYGNDYSIVIDGINYTYDEVLHFSLNPRADSLFIGQGYQIQLSDVLNNIKQANATKNAYMSSEWMPPIIISVDTNVTGLNTKEGRDKILDSYIKNDKGKPWLIPGTSMDVKQVKPLTLTDIAVNENVEIDKKTVAAVLGVPSFLLGIGEFNMNEFNNFISRTIKPIARTIEQELTRKLIISDKWYLKFNTRSLYDYDLESLTSHTLEMVKYGLMSRNEGRERFDLNAVEGLDEILVLENMIPIDESGNQKKLKDKEET